MLALKYKKTSELVIGNLFSNPHLFFKNLIYHEKLTLVDDGINSLEIRNLISTTKKITPISPLKKNLFNLLNISFDYPKEFNMFTIFKLNSFDKISIKRNNFSKLLKMNSSKHELNYTLIIGQPFLELNLLKKTDYFNFIKKIIDRNLGAKIVYFPSRKELKSNLEELSFFFDMNVSKNDFPIELEILLKGRPKKIIGFTSTALISLKKIFNSLNYNLEIESYLINCFENDKYKHRSKSSRSS